MIKLLRAVTWAECGVKAPIGTSEKKPDVTLAWKKRKI
jgi:hypothetical protein